MLPEEGSSRAAGARVIRDLTTALGRPSTTDYSKYLPDDADSSGWHAAWRLRGGERLDYYQSLGGDFAAALVLHAAHAAN